MLSHYRFKDEDNMKWDWWGIQWLLYILSHSPRRRADNGYNFKQGCHFVGEDSLYIRMKSIYTDLSTSIISADQLQKQNIQKLFD